METIIAFRAAYRKYQRDEILKLEMRVEPTDSLAESLRDSMVSLPQISHHLPSPSISGRSGVGDDQFE